MKVLVTGGKGFLGSYIADYLRALDFDVFTLSRSEDLENFKHLQVNIFELQEVDKAIKTIKPEVVIHAAWDTTLDTYMHSTINSAYQEASHHLASICATYGVAKLLVLGSSAEYGLKAEPVLAETSIAMPITEYGKAKYSLLRRLQGQGLDNVLNLAWLRIFQPYGPMQNSRRLFPTLLKQISEGGEIVIKFPFQIRDWIHVTDICQVVSFVIERNLSGIFDVGTGTGTRNLDLVHTMERILRSNRAVKVYLENSSETIIDTLVVSPEAFLFKAGFKPTIDLESGIRQILGYI